MIKLKHMGKWGFIAALAAAAVIAEGEPWRLQQALDLPDWFQLSGSSRVRYETLDNQFRGAYDGGDQQLAIRTLVEGRLQFDRWGIVGEFQDSRQEWSDEGSPVGSSMVNTAEWLQAYLQLKTEDFFQEGSSAELRLGRQTMDAGSRRLVARNRFRNTLNAFDGATLYWKSKNGPDLQYFYLLPVVRDPSARAELLENERAADQSYDDYQFWGLHSNWPHFMGTRNNLELYFYGLNEEDEGGLSTRDRELYTPGLRFYRKPARNAWDFDLELVAQFGEQRSSTGASDTTDLDHWAQFVHLELGYTRDTEWSPRVAVLFDYASGDDDPNDDESNRFDTLFGARRFEHGPTGIFGAFARSNIVSPGISLKAKPTSRLQTQLAYRAYWLASDRDAWTTGGLRDASGETDRFVGQQIEARLKWEIVPGNLSADLGLAHLFAGPFIHNAPNSNGEGDSTYAYASLVFKF